MEFYHQCLLIVLIKAIVNGDAVALATAKGVGKKHCTKKSHLGLGINFYDSISSKDISEMGVDFR